MKSSYYYVKKHRELKRTLVLTEKSTEEKKLKQANIDEGTKNSDKEHRECY